ncbi:MAG: TonB family protein [bacterium]
MRLFYSFILSLIINIGIVFFLPYIGIAKKVRVYKVYKIDLVKIREEKKPVKIEKQRQIVAKKEEIKEPVKEEPKLPYLPIEEEKEEIKEEGIIPVVKEEAVVEPHIILPVAQEEKPGIFEPGSLDAPLKLISYTQPKYPDAAKENGINGIVKLKLLINPDGMVDKVEIIEENPKNFGFAKEALKVVKGYRFTRPMVLENPVFVHYILPLRFSLED